MPLIDRHAAIAKALELIDREGLDAFNIRRLGDEIGVSGTSLYHHFKDKDEILEEVRALVLFEARVIPPRARKATWQDYVTTSATRYRSALVRHPNTAPLMAPGRMRTIGIRASEHLVSKMIEAGVPARHAYPIIDSAETLAFGSAMLNPRQLAPAERLDLQTRADATTLKHAIRSGPATAERLFRVELQVLVDGWVTLIQRESAANGSDEPLAAAGR